jgi:parvulin-like peptidyl-prolyl isomerase
MAKRDSSSGQPKNPESKKPAETEKAKNRPSKAREFRSRAEREAQTERIIVLVTSVVIGVLVVGLLGIFIFQQFIAPNLTVATVNGQNITVAEFQERVRFERVLHIQRLNNVISFYQQLGQDPNQLLQQEPYATWWNELRLPEQMGNRVVNDMVNDLLVRTTAAEMGITVNDEQVQQAIDEFFGYDSPLPFINGVQITPTATTVPSLTPTPLVSRTPSPTPTITSTPTLTPTATLIPTTGFTSTPTIEVTATWTPAPTLEPTVQTDNQRIDDFNTALTGFYEMLVTETGMSYADIRTYFETQALRKLVCEAVCAIGETATYAHIRHILVATEEEANQVIASLNAGESFADLARAVSTDTGSGAQGGDLGWAPISQYVTDYVDEFATASRDAALGSIVGPIQSQFGYHVIQVLEREERELDDQTLQTARDKALDAWFTGRRAPESGVSIATYANIWSSYVPDEPEFALQ